MATAKQIYEMMSEEDKASIRNMIEAVGKQKVKERMEQPNFMADFKNAKAKAQRTAAILGRFCSD